LATKGDASFLIEDPLEAKVRISKRSRHCKMQSKTVDEKETLSIRQQTHLDLQIKDELFVCEELGTAGGRIEADAGRRRMEKLPRQNSLSQLLSNLSKRGSKKTLTTTYTQNLVAE
jgi:hypothetical protein